MPQPRTPRFPFNRPVRVAPRDGNLPARRLLAANISRGGMFVRSLEPLPAGCRIEVSLEEQGKAVPFAEAEVVWSRPSMGGTLKGRTAGFGLRFLDMPASSHELLDSLLSRFLGTIPLAPGNDGVAQGPQLPSTELVAPSTFTPLEENDAPPPRRAALEVVPLPGPSVNRPVPTPRPPPQQVARPSPTPPPQPGVKPAPASRALGRLAAPTRTPVDPTPREPPSSRPPVPVMQRAAPQTEPPVPVQHESRPTPRKVEVVHFLPEQTLSLDDEVVVETPAAELPTPPTGTPQLEALELGPQHHVGPVTAKQPLLIVREPASRLPRLAVGVALACAVVAAAVGLVRPWRFWGSQRPAAPVAAVTPREMVLPADSVAVVAAPSVVTPAPVSPLADAPAAPAVSVTGAGVAEPAATERVAQPSTTSKMRIEVSMQRFEASVGAPEPEAFELKWAGGPARRLRLSGSDSTLSVHVELAEEGQWQRSFLLTQPDRLAIDLSGPVATKNASYVVEEVPTVSAVRVGVHEDTTRLVLDLKRAPASVRRSGTGLELTFKPESP